MHIYTSSFFKFRNKANFYSFLGASAGMGAPRNTQKIGTQCGCEYGYKNYESFGSLVGIQVETFNRILLSNFISKVSESSYRMWIESEFQQ